MDNCCRPGRHNVDGARRRIGVWRLYVHARVLVDSLETEMRVKQRVFAAVVDVEEGRIQGSPNQRCRSDECHPPSHRHILIKA